MSKNKRFILLKAIFFVTCNLEISYSTNFRITQQVTDNIVVWENRPMELVYPIIWMDGKKEDLRLWLGKNESAATDNLNGLPVPSETYPPNPKIRSV